MSVIVAPKAVSRSAEGELIDRRALPRVAVQAPVQLELAGLPGPLQADACDLSVGGICVRTPSSFALKSLGRVVLSLPDGSITLEATGRWQWELSGDAVFLSGVEFVDPGEEHVYRVWDAVHQAAKDLTQFLTRQSDLRELPLAELMELAHATRFREVRCGRWIYREGSRAPGEDSIFVIMRGSAILESRSARGRKLVLGKLGPGRLFGGLPLVADVAHGEGAVAADDVALLDISRGAFEHFKRSKPDLAFRLSTAVIRNYASGLHTSLRNAADGG